MTGLRNIDDKNSNPREDGVRRCDRESLPKAKCIMSLFVMEQTEPKMDVEFTLALSVEFWMAVSKLSKPSVWAYGPKLINIVTE